MVLILKSMDVSEIHLEKALEEYNEKVNRLENDGDVQDLIEAYVNRGSVLYMLGYNTSAMEDLTTASELIDELSEKGEVTDAGTYVKAHATMGAILFEQNSDSSGEYSKALKRLPQLRTDSRHFDLSGIIRMCVESAENLLDDNDPENAMSFVDKALSILKGKDDRWSGNRRMELYTLQGECYLAMQDFNSAIESYSEAIAIGTDLVDRSMIEDMEELVVPIISRSQCESELGLDDMYISDIELAINLLEEMERSNRLSDVEVLVNLHHDAASFLMSKGRMADAEKHLLHAVSMGVNGAKDYLRNQTNTQL